MCRRVLWGCGGAYGAAGDALVELDRAVVVEAAHRARHRLPQQRDVPHRARLRHELVHAPAAHVRDQQAAIAEQLPLPVLALRLAPVLGKALEVARAGRRVAPLLLPEWGVGVLGPLLEELPEGGPTGLGVVPEDDRVACALAGNLRCGGGWPSGWLWGPQGVGRRGWGGAGRLRVRRPLGLIRRQIRHPQPLSGGPGRDGVVEVVLELFGGRGEGVRALPRRGEVAERESGAEEQQQRAAQPQHRPAAQPVGRDLM